MQIEILKLIKHCLNLLGMYVSFSKYASIFGFYSTILFMKYFKSFSTLKHNSILQFVIFVFAAPVENHRTKNYLLHSSQCHFKDNSSMNRLIIVIKWIDVKWMLSDGSEGVSRWQWTYSPSGSGLYESYRKKKTSFTVKIKPSLHRQWSSTWRNRITCLWRQYASLVLCNIFL